MVYHGVKIVKKTLEKPMLKIPDVLIRLESVILFCQFCCYGMTL